MTKEQLLQRALDALGPAAPTCCGCVAEWEIAITAIKEALTQPEQEPVAWPTMPPSIGQSPVLVESGYDEGWAKCMSMCKAAMTSPPKRQPLTLEEIDALDFRAINAGPDSQYSVRFARAIEAAHGIGDKT